MSETSEQTDASGLIYMQARMYVPVYGRFLSPDPARDQHFEETQSWNIYSYVQNDPTMRIDPTGMFWEELKNRFAGSGRWETNTQRDSRLRAEAAANDQAHPNAVTIQLHESVQFFKKNNIPLPPGVADPLPNQTSVAQANAKPPYGTTTKVPLPIPPVIDHLLREMAPKVSEKLIVTSTTNGEHNPGSLHPEGQAVDLGYPRDPKQVLRAAAESGAKFGLDEKVHPTPKTKGAHIHLQLRSGRGGSRGDLPMPSGG